MTDPTPEQREALDIARGLIEHGVPVFAAAPCPPDCKQDGHARLEFHLPKQWESIKPSLKQLDRWKPGWALAAVGGYTVDFLDEDPRSGGDTSVRELQAAGAWPNTYGIARTKSGGRHFIIAPLRERKQAGTLPGLDYQGGEGTGKDGGHAFVWIAPTVARSKGEDAGELRAYTWEEEPYWEELEAGLQDDDSGAVIRERIRASRAPAMQPAADVRSSEEERTKAYEAQVSEGAEHVHDPLMDGPLPSEYHSAAVAARGARTFTQAAAEDFVRPYLDRLRKAPIGQIENEGNNLAVTLSHFVPEFWSVDVAYALILQALEHTAYDPDGPYATWDATKFLPVLDGRRPPRDPWKAVKLPDVPASLYEPSERDADGMDPVEALLAEMLTPDEVIDRPRPRQLIQGLLTLDSEAWIIGAPGSKKSFVTLHMAGCIATGKPFLGLPVLPGTVVMIVAEGAGGMGARLDAWKRTYGAMGDLKILPRPVQAADVKAWAVLTEACRRLGPAMVVVDTQARVTVGLEENSATEMGHYVDAVSRIRQATSACVLTVHHTGRNGLDARGSSAIDGAQGTELKVVAESAFAGLLKVEKQKDLEVRPDLGLHFRRIELGVDEDGNAVSSLVLDEDEFRRVSGQEEAPKVEPWEAHHGKAQVQVLKVLRDQGGTVGLTRSQVRESVVERFYGGDAKKLHRSTFASAWTKVLEKVSTEGDRVVVSAGGQRWVLDPVAFEQMPGEAGD